MITRATLSTIEQGLPKYRSMLAGNAAFIPTGAYESIATVNGTGSVAYVDFTSIPSTYTHLQIRGIIQPNNPGGGGATLASFRINSDTGNNYSQHWLRGDGSSLSSTGGASQNYGLVAFSTQGNATNVFTGFVLDILDYANTNKFKTIRSFGGYDANGSGSIALISDLWQSTSAITAIRIFANDGLNLNVSANATFSLYGIRSA